MSLAYFRFFPGDYARDTKHLSMLQHGAYRQLIDEYMTRGPIANNLERLYRICGAFNLEEKSAIEFVLGEFFVLDGPVWRHVRCDKEQAWQAERSDRSVKANATRWGKVKPEKPAHPNGSPNGSPNWTPNQNQNQIRTTQAKSQPLGGTTDLPLSVTLLCEQGLKQSEARAYVGSLLKDWDEETIEYAFRESVGKADIRGYVRAILNNRPKKAATDKVLQKLRDEHGPRVVKTESGYANPDSGMSWDKSGKRRVTI